MQVAIRVSLLVQRVESPPRSISAIIRWYSARIRRQYTRGQASPSLGRFIDQVSSGVATLIPLPAQRFATTSPKRSAPVACRAGNTLNEDPTRSGS